MGGALQHIRGRLLWLTALPDNEGHPGVHYLQDGVLSVQGEHIQAVRSYAQYVAQGGQDAELHDVRPGLILPGFIDSHIHYPQMDIIGSFGTQLLDWLDNYAFPAELAYTDREFAQAQAQQFMRRLFEHGTTTALTFTTVHAHSTDALFEAAQAVNARMIAGKVLMNRNAPDGLLDAGTGDDENRALLERWHGRGRLAYAITPRFAITCTPEQLTAAGQLLLDYPGVYSHSHIAEHPDEVAYTLQLFPEAQDYADVYDRFGLLNDHSVFAHGIHLTEQELTRFHKAGASVAFCPTSNLFLGSGLLNLPKLQQFGVGFSVGSDVGGGTGFSLLSTLGEGYKVNQLNGDNWHPLQALYAITRGAAETLHLADKVGSLSAGLEADFVVLEPPRASVLAQRLDAESSLTGELFAYMFLDGERAVKETWVAGKRRYQREAA
ncbi:MAG: guanine deaminase [Pseudomonadota bacterium]